MYIPTSILDSLCVDGAVGELAMYSSLGWVRDMWLDIVRYVAVCFITFILVSVYSAKVERDSIRPRQTDI